MIRRVALVCLVGLILSMGSLIIIVNVMGGLGSSIKDSLLAVEPHLIITLNTRTRIQEQKQNIQQILQDHHLKTGISSMHFFETVDLVIRSTDGVFSGGVARGYDSPYLTKLLSRLPSLGNTLPDPLQTKAPSASTKWQIKKAPNDETIFMVEEASSPPPIAMGLGLASELNVYEGEKVQLIPAENLLLPSGEPLHFEVAQLSLVVSTQNEIWNTHFIFYDRQLFPHFSKNSSYSAGFEIQLTNPDNYLAYQKLLSKHGFLVETWPERNSTVFFALKIEKTIMSLFLSLAGFITLLAVSSLLVLLIVQKKREIGALMALGWPLQKIRQLFIGTGLLLCFLGLVGGCLFGLLVCFILSHYPLPFLSAFYPEGHFPVMYNWTFLLWQIIGALLLSYLSCLFCVRSQLKFSPAELLRTLN